MKLRNYETLKTGNCMRYGIGSTVEGIVLVDAYVNGKLKKRHFLTSIKDIDRTKLPIEVKEKAKGVL